MRKASSLVCCTGRVAIVQIAYAIRLLRFVKNLSIKVVFASRRFIFVISGKFHSGMKIDDTAGKIAEIMSCLQIRISAVGQADN